jgi:ankyrin repeat protein
MLRYRPGLPKRAAVAGKTRELAELLLMHGMNASQPDWLGITPLHEFARKGEVENAMIFIEQGADLDACGEDVRSTPLGVGGQIREGRDDMIELLLERGAKPNLPDDPLWATPLAWARRRRHDDVVALLKQRDAE